LKQIAPDVFHAVGLAEINSATEFVLIDAEVEDLSFSHDCGNRCGISFISVGAFSEFVVFLDALVCAFDGLFGCDGLELFDALADAVSKG
jgi:hypothetical protein